MREPSVDEIVARLEGLIEGNYNPTPWERTVGELSFALIASWRERGEALQRLQALADERSLVQSIRLQGLAAAGQPQGSGK